MMFTNMTTILSHQEDLGPSMLDVKYEGLGGTGLVTTPLNMAPNFSECNISHGGIAQYMTWTYLLVRVAASVHDMGIPISSSGCFST